jgi:LPS-assembly protein
MTRNALAVLWLAAAVLLSGGVASAQVAVVPPPPQSLPGIDTNQSWRWEQISPGHWRLTGDVELEVDKGATKISADEVEIFSDTNLLVAKGNVTLTTKTQRISADSLEFNLLTKFGTFRHASGNARIHGDDPLNAMNPAVPTPARTPATPPVANNQFGTSEPDLLFYGEIIEKVGERKYRITNGGFTTCVQPEPRWQLQSGTVVLNLDHYAMLRNMVMNVKGVPVFYLPVIFYPINKEDRATGFLMPVYGSSTLRGHTLSNAFFWAISRSQDATLMHDWFSKTGQGMGGEYRYIRSPTSRGELRTYYLNEKPIEAVDTDGNITDVPGRKSFELRGSAAQDLPLKLRARGRVDYFSDITVQQTYNSNIYDASRRSRYFGGNLAGTWKAYSVSSSFDSNQYFFNSTDSTTSGSLPRINFSRGEQPIKGTPIYFGIGSEFVSMVRKTEGVGTLVDASLNRLDATPTIRYGFTKIPFFTVNTSLAWRYTWWSDSLDPESGVRIAAPVTRTYYDLQARLVGPIFTRIWNTADNAYAEKYKHTIEPWVNLQRVTMFDNQDQIIALDSTDYVYGGTTRITFGLNNRVYAKHRAQGGRAREFVNVQIQQTYYSDDRASTVDPAYSTSFGGTRPQKLSPFSLAARFTPNEQIGASFNTSYNTYVNAFLNYAAVGTYAYQDKLQVSSGWNQRRYVPGLEGYDNPASASHFLSAEGIFRLSQNRYGGGMSINYDLKNDYFLQSRFFGFYNAQCCGISFQYQTYDFGSYSYNGVTKDKRFSVAITLAGLGSFNPFFGGMGGGSNQMYR